MCQPGGRKTGGHNLNPSFSSIMNDMATKGRGAVRKITFHKSSISERGPTLSSGRNKTSLFPAIKRGMESEISGGGGCKRLRGGGGR